MLNYRAWTNTKYELIALWLLLYFAKIKDMVIQRVLWDSKIVIEWARGETQLNPTHLIFWKQLLSDLIQSHLVICFNHIYKEYNTMADALSKSSMREIEGWIVLKKDKGSILVDQGQIDIYQYL